ncbi:hypothetical protein WJX72_006520 [[Myrmecia] bisecta]|uniref:C3H1-type domain-containing protein n=1 Tax=[Myrmecia] bisecta TaxID=41462 RepID=A0AAW1PTY0_9CHLO
MIELAQGCNHMTCKCGAQFCYVCGEAWVRKPQQPGRFQASCECALWDEANIIEPAQNPAQHNAEVARNRNRHNPRHPFYKTQLCRHHPHCRNGDYCNFAHGVHELRGRPGAAQPVVQYHDDLEDDNYNNYPMNDDFRPYYYLPACNPSSAS